MLKIFGGMVGKYKSGFGFKSGFNDFCQIQLIWIGFDLFSNGGFGFELFQSAGFGFENCWIGIWRWQIQICGFGFEPPNLDLTIFQKVGFGLDLSFVKGVDLDLKVELDLDLDLDLNITGFARHWLKLMRIQHGGLKFWHPSKSPQPSLFFWAMSKIGN